MGKSSDSSPLKLCPEITGYIKNTIGNERQARQMSNEGSRKWIELNGPIIAEYRVWGQMVNVLKQEAGTLFYSFMMNGDKFVGKKHMFEQLDSYRYTSESDIFVVLHKYKLVMNIEIKNSEKIESSMDKAKKQLRNMKEWLCINHGDILDGWKYAAVACFPKCNNKEGYNPKFIISKDDLESEHGMLNWWHNLKEELSDSVSQEEDFENYRKFLNHTVGIFSLETDFRKTSSQWSEVIHQHLIGEGALAVTPGFTEDDRAAKKRNRPYDPCTKMSKVPKTATVLMWTPDQQALLSTSPNNVLFTSDFGTGEITP